MARVFRKGLTPTRVFIQTLDCKREGTVNPSLVIFVIFPRRLRQRRKVTCELRRVPGTALWGCLNSCLKTRLPKVKECCRTCDQVTSTVPSHATTSADSNVARTKRET